MRRLLNRGIGPPVDANGRSFRYTHETGHVSHGVSYWDWEIAIREHRKGNNLPMPSDLMARAEDQLCGGLPPHLCLHESGDPPSTDIRIQFTDVVNWLKAVGKKVVSGAAYVDQAESERRAAICVQCPLNVTIIGGCGGGCKKIAEFFTPGMAKLKTTQDARLRSCAVCRCYGAIQVHFPMSVLASGESAEQQAAYPKEYCWKSKSSSNYVG